MINKNVGVCVARTRLLSELRNWSFTHYVCYKVISRLCVLDFFWIMYFVEGLLLGTVHCMELCEDAFG